MPLPACRHSPSAPRRTAARHVLHEDDVASVEWSLGRVNASGRRTDALAHRRTMVVAVRDYVTTTCRRTGAAVRIHRRSRCLCIAKRAGRQAVESLRDSLTGLATRALFRDRSSTLWRVRIACSCRSP